MTEAEAKYARENFVEHRLDLKSRELLLRGLNPTGQLYRRQMKKERLRVSK